ncbi:MAG: transposase family protein, partial [Candidatus Brocadiaceae bacterium]|nr:transposase family protein [Candidatus Brocadiaceae bacterium]
RFYDHLSFKDGLIILTTPVKSQREFIFAERVIVPISLYRTVFMLAHTGLTGGHRGVQETLSKINRHFVMPYVNKYVHAAVASCITCLNRRKKGTHDHTIINSPLAGESMSEVAIDSLGPLTPCEFNGIICRHILILIDSYSRYVWLYPIADVTAETIVNCLKVNFFSVMGCCDRLRSDNATSFKSKLFKEVCQRLGVEQVFIPPRSPQSNYSERYNQSVYAYLKCDLRFSEAEWAKKLQAAQFCMNASFNRRLGCSPYYKMYLRAPKLPLDSFDPMTREKINSMSFSELLEALEANWKSGQKKTDRYLQIENASRTSKPIEVNSYCYIYYDVVQIGLSKKLQSMWIGPCLVTKVISECLYE